MFLSRLKEDIQTIRQKDPAARSTMEILTCYPGLHALIFHRMAHALWVKEWYLLARALSHISRGFTGIEIHPAALLGRRVFMDHGMGIVIGETAIVGDDCTLYQGVTLGGTALTRGKKRHPTLEPGVVIGAGAQVLGSFTVGAGAKIGSNAVVVKAVPADATVVGNPAHIIGTIPSTPHEFNAYGVNGADGDPIVQALHQLLAHLQRTEDKQNQLREKLISAGIDCGNPCTEGTKEIERLKELLNESET